MTEPIRRSPVGRMHRALGATFGVESGWELPVRYGDEIAERALLRDSVALADVTPRGKIDVRGALGGALSASGDALVARVSDTWAIVLTGPGREDDLVDAMEAAGGAGSMVTDATHLMAGFALAGRDVSEALALLSSWDPSTLSPGEATGAPIGDVRAVVVRRDLGMPVLEIYVPTESARFAWETALDAVRRVGGGPAGWVALRAEGWS